MPHESQIRSDVVDRLCASRTGPVGSMGIPHLVRHRGGSPRMLLLLLLLLLLLHRLPLVALKLPS